MDVHTTLPGQKMGDAVLGRVQNEQRYLHRAESSGILLEEMQREGKFKVIVKMPCERLGPSGGTH